MHGRGSMGTSCHQDGQAASECGGCLSAWGCLFSQPLYRGAVPAPPESCWPGDVLGEMLPGHSPGFGGASSHLVSARRGLCSLFCRTLKTRPEPCRPPLSRVGGCGCRCRCRAGSRRSPAVPGDGDVSQGSHRERCRAGKAPCPALPRMLSTLRAAPVAAALRLFVQLRHFWDLAFPVRAEEVVKINKRPFQQRLHPRGSLGKAGGEGFILPTSPFWLVLGVTDWGQHVSPPCAIPGLEPPGSPSPCPLGDSFPTHTLI